MPYCPRCGTPLPQNEEAKFCPNCGLSIVPSIYKKTGTLVTQPTKQHGIMPRRSRLTIFAVIFVLCIIVTAIGAATTIDPDTASQITNELNQKQNAIQVAGVQIIFGNNLMHALIMFIPGLGPIWGFYVLYNTGVAISAIGAVATPPLNPLFLFVSLFITPFAWLEYISYSVAISESLWLLSAMTKRRFRAELNPTYRYVTICAIMLLIGAIIETALILAG